MAALYGDEKKTNRARAEKSRCFPLEQTSIARQTPSMKKKSKEDLGGHWNGRAGGRKGFEIAKKSVGKNMAKSRFRVGQLLSTVKKTEFTNKNQMPEVLLGITARVKKKKTLVHRRSARTLLYMRTSNGMAIVSRKMHKTVRGRCRSSKRK